MKPLSQAFWKVSVESHMPGWAWEIYTGDNIGLDPEPGGKTLYSESYHDTAQEAIEDWKTWAEINGFTHWKIEEKVYKDTQQQEMF